MIGLKPWEYYRYTQREYDDLVKGFELRQQLELDRVRWLATIIAKSNGAKKIKRPSDLMKLPLIDAPNEEETKAAMIEFLRAQRTGGG